MLRGRLRCLGSVEIKLSLRLSGRRRRRRRRRTEEEEDVFVFNDTISLI